MDTEFVPYFMQEVLARADAGDGEACFDVAEYYYAQKDYVQAVKWYKKTVQCSDPNPNAYFNLGYACQYGEGTEKDMFAAFEYYQKAAEQNLPQAMNNLAFFYESGIVVAQDQDKADALCRQATTVMNNLQTELYKARKQCRQLEIGLAEAQKQAEQADAKAAEADERTQKALLEVAGLQEKLRAAGTQSQKLAAQNGTIEKLRQENSQLRTRKPFLRKRTLLCWLDVFVLALLGCQLTSDWMMGELELYQTRLLLSCAAIAAVCILGWVLLSGKRFVLYGLLHWLNAVIVGGICLLAFSELEPMLPYLAAAAILLWMGVASFIGESV